MPWDESNAGQYLQQDIELAGGKNDAIVSLEVPKGYTAILYREDGFNDEMIRLKGDYEFA